MENLKRTSSLNTLVIPPSVKQLPQEITALASLQALKLLQFFTYEEIRKCS